MFSSQFVTRILLYLQQTTNKEDVDDSSSVDLTTTGVEKLHRNTAFSDEENHATTLKEAG